MRRPALLVTPLPPVRTGLSTFAARLVALTRESVRWTVAFTEGSAPIPDAECIPLGEFAGGLPEGPRLFQLGNSPHCAPVIRALETWGGAGLFHEVNLHHVLRHMSNTSGDWAPYRVHMARQYGKDTERMLRVMGRKAESEAEYDMRLRSHPLFVRVLECCSSALVLNRFARELLAPHAGARPLLQLGHPLDPLPPELGVPPSFVPDRPILGVVGGFGHGRGWEHVLQVTSSLALRRECNLIAAGEGWPDPGMSRVKVLGRLPEPEYQAAIRTFRIGLDLRGGSCGETSGSLLEMLRAGVPCVISDAGSFREIPADAVLRVSSKALPDSAAAAVEYLLDHPELRDRMGERAAEYAREQGDPVPFRKRIHRILDADLAGRGS